MGGSGLIVVVIVAAWALFLVPQWLHRRAEAAARLADRVPDPEHDDDAPTATRRRFGRRELVRRPAATSGGRRWWRRRGDGPAVTVHAASSRPPAEAGQPPLEHSVARTAAARRRRVLTLLAGATLLAVGVVGVAAVLGRPLPGWLVAVPGGLMVGYLVLLAVVRPGAPRHQPGVQERRDAEPLDADPPSAPATPVDAQAGERAEPVPVASGVPADTWTPVPLPAPTYVTAPRAPRAVRTIDLSNPGSWTAARLGVAPDGSSAVAASPDGAVATRTSGDEAAASTEASDGDWGGHEWGERRRAVGD